MQTHRIPRLAVGVAIALSVAAAPAVAVEQDEELLLLHPWGMSLSVGVGLNGFPGQRMSAATEPGGSWDLRFGLGTREVIALELAYVGSAHRIGAVGMDEATLMSAAFEAALRMHIADGAWRPYFLLGVASRHYYLDYAEYNTSDMRNQDDVLEVPFGMGLSFRRDRLVLDARVVYRPAAYTSFVKTEPDERSPLDNYDLSARVGIEF
jgi:hypothetical protein